MRTAQYYLDGPHGARLPDDCYWACEKPEAPYSEPHTNYDLDCRACVLALGALATRMPDEPMGDGWTPLTVYNAKREAHGLPELRVHV